jgi:hypothetical protein
MIVYLQSDLQKLTPSPLTSVRSCDLCTIATLFIDQPSAKGILDSLAQNTTLSHCKCSIFKPLCSTQSFNMCSVLLCKKFFGYIHHAGVSFQTPCLTHSQCEFPQKGHFFGFQCKHSTNSG